MLKKWEIITCHDLYLFWALGLSASVKTTDLWYEPVWKNYSKLQVKILKHNSDILVLIARIIKVTFLFSMQFLQEMQTWPHGMEIRYVLVLFYSGFESLP